MGTRVLFNQFWKRLRGDARGQDIIEYALVAGLVSLSAGATMPGVAGGLTTVLSKVGVVLDSATAPGVTSEPPGTTPPPSTNSGSGSGNGGDHHDDGHGRD